MTSASNIIYARLSRRIKAVMIDGIVLSLLLYLSVLLPIFMDLEDPTIPTIVGIALAISIEPLFVSFKGASIGHQILGIRIRKARVEENLNLFTSYLRFICKLPLGILSLVSVVATQKNQALHDLLSRSIVVLNNPEDFPSWEREPERVLDNENYVYPSKTRRAAVIAIYIFFSLLTLSIATTVLQSDPCIAGRRCSNLDSVFELGLSISFWISIFFIVGLGSQGRLFGCSRRTRDA